MSGFPRNLKVLIPACGHSQRFRDEGILTPKALIRFSLDGGPEMTMLEHAVPSRHHDRVFVVVLEKDYKLFSDALPPRFSIIPVIASGGQLSSIVQGAFYLGDDPLLVVNCDNKFRDDDLDSLMNVEEDVGALVFESNSTSFGYIDSYPIFKQGREKICISRYAVAGAFFFRQASIFKKNTRYLLGNYLTEFFQQIKGDKRAILIDREKMYDFGTPQLLREYYPELKELSSASKDVV